MLLSECLNPSSVDVISSLFSFSWNSFGTGIFGLRSPFNISMSEKLKASLGSPRGLSFMSSSRFSTHMPTYPELDNTNSNGLSHVSDGKSSKRWVLSEGLNTHWLGWDHLDDSSITRLDELRVLLHLLTSSSVDLLEQLVESTSNVGGVAVQNWRVTSGDLTRVVQDDDLSVERSSTLRWVVLGVTTDVTSSDFLNGNVLDVETNVVTWNTLSKLLVVHLNGLDFSGNTSWSESNNHTSLDDTGLDSSDWNSSNTTDLVDILQWQSQWLVRWSGRWLNGVNSLQKSLTLDDTSLGLLLPSLVPWAVSRSLNHVVTVPTRNWDEWNSLRVVTNLLDEVRGFLDNFLKSGLVPLNRVHLVDSNNQLSDTKGESKQSVLSGLTILGDTSLELTGTTSNNQDSTVSLGSTSDHVLDEISVTWSVDDGNVVLWSLEFPQSNIDSDTSLSLSLQLVQNPSVLERTLSELSSFLFKLLDGSLVDTTTLVDQVAGSGRFTRVDVTNNNDVNVSLFFSHCKLLTNPYDQMDDASISNSISTISKRRRRRTGSLRLSKKPLSNPTQMFNVWGVLQVNDNNKVAEMKGLGEYEFMFGKDQEEKEQIANPDTNMNSSILKSIMKPNKVVDEEQFRKKTVSFRDEISVRSNSLNSMNKATSIHVYPGNKKRNYRQWPVQTKLLNPGLFQRPTSKELAELKDESSELEGLCFEPDHNTPENVDHTLDTVFDASSPEEIREAPQVDKLDELGKASFVGTKLSPLFESPKSTPGIQDAASPVETVIGESPKPQTPITDDIDLHEIDEKIKTLKQKRKELVKKQRQNWWFHGGLFKPRKAKLSSHSPPASELETEQATEFNNTLTMLESLEAPEPETAPSEYSTLLSCSSDCDTTGSRQRLDLREFFKKKHVSSRPQASDPGTSVLEDLRLTSLTLSSRGSETSHVPGSYDDFSIMDSGQFTANRPLDNPTGQERHLIRGA
ncbi:hypothetical protein OGAPHI_005900 [Ogataea philodendri]|uniref:Uncharacterized protein n=1 Tax=Ogataea philodendri TaxID=1378263 RepID=A0A9P8NYU6_9ASCO|nr:uncharacterized protein OGAPHI_005900 [Ogataea philodendri]KAH3661722.1 hypothetical protein OGAPHI_005900 [Ogataea philodendri]